MTEFEKEQLNLELSLKYKEKNIFLAYAFLAFLGIFGVHRFYLGHYLSGIIMFFLTISWIMSWVSGIWVIVDIYFVYKYVEEHNMEVKLLKLRELKQRIPNYQEELKEIKIENY